MTEKFVIKQHDLLPDLQVKLLSDGNPVDLLNATSVTFVMQSRKTGVKVAANMVIHDQTDPDTLGVVSYRWKAGDTDFAGDFNGEFQVNWPGGLPQTFPAHSYIVVSIEKDLGGNPPPPIIGP